jgi:hypothetical protein
MFLASETARRDGSPMRGNGHISIAVFAEQLETEIILKQRAAMVP